ncbi:MAG: tetratricopeptide repeat protein [Chloroflexota bacterium]
MTEKTHSGTGRPANLGVAEEYVRIGDEYAAEEQWDKAFEMYKAAIKRYPTLADTYFRRGLVYMALEQYIYARWDFDRAIELGLYTPEVYLNRGYEFLKYMSAFPVFAINDLDEAIRLKPDYLEAYFQRAQIYQIIGARTHKKRILEDLDTVLHLNPEHAGAYYARGRMNDATYLGGHFDFKEYEAQTAIKDFTRSIELNFEELHLPYTARGKVYYRLAEYDLAMADVQKALEIEPQFEWADKIRLDIIVKTRRFKPL